VVRERAVMVSLWTEVRFMGGAHWRRRDDDGGFHLLEELLDTEDTLEDEVAFASSAN
jgi:hypothetical protein